MRILSSLLFGSLALFGCSVGANESGAAARAAALSGGTLGDSTSCKSLDAWKAFAAAACASENLVLSDYAASESCGEEGGQRYLKFSCASAAAGVDETPPPPATNTPPQGATDGTAASMCVHATQGGETSCKDDATWKGYARVACEAMGLELTEATFSSDCGGGSRTVKYGCCPKTEVPKPDAPPPSDPPPSEDPGAPDKTEPKPAPKDPDGAKPEGENKPEAEAPPTEPAPPASGRTCETITIGKGDVCVATWDWKQPAGDVCAAIGRSAAAVVPTKLCADETTSLYAEVTCCD